MGSRKRRNFFFNRGEPESGIYLLLRYVFTLNDPFFLVSLSFLLIFFLPETVFGFGKLVPTIDYLSTIMNDKLSAPIRISVDSEYVYVSDPGRQRVQIFKLNGQFRSTIGGLARPLGIAVGRAGNIYIGNDSDDSVMELDFSGSLISRVGLGKGEFDMPSDIAVDYESGGIFVVDSDMNHVRVYNSRGKLDFVIEGFIFPTGIHVDMHRGELLVSDSGNYKVKIFDLSGKLLRSFGSSMAKGGIFGSIYGLTVDESGRIYVADSYKGSVLVFDSTGNYLSEIGKEELSTPLDVTIDHFNRLLVSSYGTNSVVIYGIDGGGIPIASIFVNNGALYTNSKIVTLSLACLEGNDCREMRFRNNGSSWSAWQPFASTVTWNLSAGDGVKRINGQFKGGDSGVSKHRVSIIYDTSPPSGVLTVNDGAESTGSLEVNLFISAMDVTTFVAGMRFRNESSDWSKWENFSEKKVWRLSKGEKRTRTVHLQLRDAAGNDAYSYALIVFDPAESLTPSIAQHGSDVAGDKIANPRFMRTDGGKQGNNLDIETNKPRVDIEYTFEVLIRDPEGRPPQYVRLYITQRENPALTDFYSYDMECAGDWVDGASCTYTTKLGPASVHKYHFAAMLSNGSLVRYPLSGEDDGPVVELLNGNNMVGLPRSLPKTESLDGSAGFGNDMTFRWVSDQEPDSLYKGEYKLVKKDDPVRAGEGYLVKKGAGMTTLPLYDKYSEITAPEFTIQIKAGWNIISNPYSGNVKLSDIKIKRGKTTPIEWSQAIESGWLINAIYYYAGNDWGSTYFFESAYSAPDAILVPWLAYWVYLNKADENYSLIIPRGRRE